MNKDNEIYPLKDRFRSYLPVVIDVETGGFNHRTDALLEVAVVFLQADEKQTLNRYKSHNWHIEPFEGANLDPKSLEVNGINPDHPFRRQIAVHERQALNELFKLVRQEMKVNQCTRAILVGHNAAFDLNFINAAVERLQQKRNPFHPFSTFDTVTLAAMAYGQTVLARGVKMAGLGWDSEQAHSALYDAEKTADLFCKVINDWQMLDGAFKAMSV
ncbi:MAG TPA: ribonuclease T [Thiothrix sp.]|nr:ribonuclease T [Thiothrix sp.]